MPIQSFAFVSEIEPYPPQSVSSCVIQMKCIILFFSIFILVLSLFSCGGCNRNNKQSHRIPFHAQTFVVLHFTQGIFIKQLQSIEKNLFFFSSSSVRRKQLCKWLMHITSDSARKERAEEKKNITQKTIFENNLFLIEVISIFCRCNLLYFRSYSNIHSIIIITHSLINFFCFFICWMHCR